MWGGDRGEERNGRLNTEGFVADLKEKRNINTNERTKIKMYCYHKVSVKNDVR